jgi:Tol biopolymer transport system component
MGIWRVGIDELTGERRGEPQQLTVGGPSITGHLSMSRDGRRMAYHEMLVQSRIESADYDPSALKLSSERRVVVKGSRELTDLEVSPDGEWLVYRTGDARQDIYIAKADGSGERQVTDDTAKDWRPRWSPDGRKLAFYSNASGTYQVWVVNRDGSGRMRLTNSTARQLLDPVWSPDGSQIIYSDSDGAFIVKSDAPFEKQTVRAVPPMTVNGAPAVFRPSDWSGVAGKIAGGGVTLYSPASGRFESLSTGAPVAGAHWLPDGQHVYYRRGQGPVVGTWHLLDTKARVERTIDVPPTTRLLRLSPDATRAYLLETINQPDIWLLTIK